MLDYMNGKFLEIKLNTNGILLSDDISRCILKNEVTDLITPIDSYEKENYEKIRRKARVDKVIANIERFMEIREKNFQTTELVFEFLVLKSMSIKTEKSIMNFGQN